MPYSTDRSGEDLASEYRASGGSITAPHSYAHDSRIQNIYEHIMQDFAQEYTTDNGYNALKDCIIEFCSFNVSNI